MKHLLISFEAGWRSVAGLLCGIAALALLLSCGGGGGGGTSSDTASGSPGGTPPSEEVKGVFSGFKGDPDWELSSTGADAGVGAGADGDGGVGGGGDFGQFRNALIVVKFPNGTELGRAKTDPNDGMVTIKPGKTYQGPLYLELQGASDASYYEEGKGEFVPFPADRVIRVWVPKITKNIGITPFTDAGFRLLTEGSTPERVSGIPTSAQISAANDKIRDVLNQQFPRSVHVDDITRMPFIKSPTIAPGSIKLDKRGAYGLVNGAFSKQAAMFNANEPTPTLAALTHFGEDMLDGKLDGMRDAQPAAPAGKRTYDPHTYTGELSSALAEQSYRFGNDSAVLELPAVLNYGNSRYAGYLYDASLKPNGNAVNTVVGTIGNEPPKLGAKDDKQPPNTPRVFGVYGNFGHGGGFLKSDAANSQSKIYAFGDNTNGELGNGEVGLGGRRDAGALVEITLPQVLTHVAGGFAHTVARLADGSVYTWGDNSYSQLGQGLDGAALAKATTPVKVQLPSGAVAVAATSTASYALLEDGRVFSWGSSAGFGLLGDGGKDGVRNTPGPVMMAAGGVMTDVVQIAARDNDAVVLRRDGSVLNWGSFPVDAPVAGEKPDVTAPYKGGTALPAPVTGLPTGVQIRKLLTEQGLFSVLTSDGAVYSWGVHFDITANAVLRDLTPARVLGLPPVRDLMPGGFLGYSERPFDRSTAMAIDPRGGMWKVRGRVAEQFDPEKPTLRRRPEGQPPRSDCQSCHVVLNDWPLKAPAPTNNSTCVPPPSIHGGSGSPSLIHSDTKCEQCHNPSRITPTLTTGWLNCVKPSDLPARQELATPKTQPSCSMPTGHVHTPPGTQCASCHNSVIAQPLKCTQPSNSEPPSIAATVRIDAALNDAGAPIAPGSITSDTTPTLQGTIGAGGLQTGQTVRVLRNGSAVGQATVAGTSWEYRDSGAGNGSQTYTARVEAGTAFGAVSNSYQLTIDGDAPKAGVAIKEIRDDELQVVVSGKSTSDRTPTVVGSLNPGAALGSGESVQVLRNGSAVSAPVTVSGTTWSFVEPVKLDAATHVYRARVVDAAGNPGPLSDSVSVMVVTSVAASTISSARNEAGATVKSDGATQGRKLQLQGTTAAVLPAGQAVRVLRNNVLIPGEAKVNGTTWTFDDPSPDDGRRVYTARVEVGTVVGDPSAAYVVTIDNIAPKVTADVTGITDDISGALPAGGTTSDTTPTVLGSLTDAALLEKEEQVELLRNSAVIATLRPDGKTWSYTEPKDAALSQGTYVYRARVVDAAGNTSEGTSREVTINTSVPLPNAKTTITAVNGTALGGASSVAVNSITKPTIAGSIQRALGTSPEEVVRIYRNNEVVASLKPGGTEWSYTSPALKDGTTYTFLARIEQSANPANHGQSSSVSDPIDATPPRAIANVTGIADDISGPLPAGGATSDTTPIVLGSIDSALLEKDEQVELLRNDTVIATFRPDGKTWSYTEPNKLGLATYVYQARVIDAAKNINVGASQQVTIDTSVPLPGAATKIRFLNGIDLGDATSVKVNGNRTPTIAGEIQRALNTASKEGVRIYRNGDPVGYANMDGTAWSYTSPELQDGEHTFYARIEQSANPAIHGKQSNQVTDPIDGPPSTIVDVININAVNASGIGEPVVAGRTTLTRLTVQGEVRAALAPGERVQLRRNQEPIATFSPRIAKWSYAEPDDLPAGGAKYVYQACVLDASGQCGALGADQSVVIDSIDTGIGLLRR